MDWSDPRLLPFRRGPFDGQKFFSRSPFRSGYFLTASAACLLSLCITFVVMYRNWGRLGTFEVILLAQLAWGLGMTWWRNLQNIDRVRQLYEEGSITKVEPGSPLDVALASAGGATNELLFFYSASTAILVAYVGHLLAR
jgi:hypothetical protein